VAGSKVQKPNKAALTQSCGKQVQGSKGDKSFTQDTNQLYYKRGSGALPLEGPEEYASFSKAFTGNEDDFGKKPDDVMYFGNKIGKFRGREVSGMPIAIAMWRYTQYYHSFLPSMHDVMVGMWKPRPHEVKAGLKQRDFCTVASLVVAMSVLNSTKGAFDQVQKAAPGGKWPIENADCKDAKTKRTRRCCK